MNGLKPVRVRRDDPLARIDWQQLEVLLAVYYRGQGYQVEHVGTGATGRRSDGGIDLKLRRADEYVLVQVKHWNACQVPHNDVHQLLGLMVNEAATGAILVTSGEFTKAAIEAATRRGHVQLVDGDELRACLGPLPGAGAAPPASVEPRDGPRHGQGDAGRVVVFADAHASADAFARAAGERLLHAAEERIRYGARGRHRVGSAAATGFNLVLLKLALAAVMVGLVWTAVRVAMVSLQAAVAPRPASTTVTPPVLPAPTGTPGLMSSRGDAPVAVRDIERMRRHEPTAAEIREAQRRADEAIRVIGASTPDM